MKTKTQQFNVTYVSPFNGRKMRSIEVPADSIYMADSGEIVYRYNDFYPACEVIEVEEVSQELLDAKLAYFTKHGTANE